MIFFLTTGFKLPMLCRLVRKAQAGRIAQLVEQRPFKPWVEGSNPSALRVRLGRRKIALNTQF